MYKYKAKVIQVVDGDTYDLLVDLGFGILKKERFRLYGVDTPETHRPKTAAEKEHGELTTARIKSLIEGLQVTVKTYKDSKEKYGRYLCDIFTDNDVNLSDYLRDNDLLKRDNY